MTEPRQSGDRHRRAKLTMVGVTCVCILLASTPAVVRLAAAGWGSFVNRPPGVGGSASSPAAASPEPVDGTAPSAPVTPPAHGLPEPAPPPPPARPPRSRRPPPRHPRQAAAPLSMLLVWLGAHPERQHVS